MENEYQNPNAEPNSNFKKIPLNSKLWRDSSFDEVSIVIVYGFDTDSDVYMGIYEARKDTEMLRNWYLRAPHKLSEVSCNTCGAEWHFGQRLDCCKWENMKKGNSWNMSSRPDTFNPEYIEAIYTPKRNVDISTAMELWLF